MDITLIINNRDFSDRLSTYQVTKETGFGSVVATLGGVEHVGGRTSRDLVTFTLLPGDDKTARRDYRALQRRVVKCTYYNPHTGVRRTRDMRVVSDLSQTFGLRAANGSRYYKSGAVTLRALRCD